MAPKTFIHGSFQPITSNFSAPFCANSNHKVNDRHTKWALNALCNEKKLGQYVGPAIKKKSFIYFMVIQKGIFFFFRVRDNFKNPVLWDIEKKTPLLKLI